MRQYELMIILDPNLSNEENTTLIQEITDEVKTLNVVDLKTDLWGTRDLAYKINGSYTGYYLMLTFGGEGLSFFEVIKNFNLKKAIWRHMFVKIDE